MDRILDGVPGWALGVSPVRDVLVGEVLYHEIGHHAHHTVARQFR